MDAKLIEASISADRDAASEVMCEILTDTEVTTYKMWEELANKALASTDAERRAIDWTVSLLTGRNLTEIAGLVLGASESGEEDAA